MRQATTYALTIAVTLLAGLMPIWAAPAPERLTITLPTSLKIGQDSRKVSPITDQQFVELFGQIVEAFNADSKKFGTETAGALTTIYDLVDNPDAQGVFSISPMFNRDLLVATLMVSNRIQMDDDDFARLKNTFAEYARMTDKQGERMLVAIIYGSLLAEWKHP